MQLWMYETLYNLGDFVDFNTGGKVPRILKWRTVELSSWNDVSTIFRASTIHN